jgi:hypothetical protein
MSIRKAIEDLTAKHAAIQKEFRDKETKLKTQLDEENAIRAQLIKVDRIDLYTNEAKFNELNKALSEVRSDMDKADYENRQEFRQTISGEKKRIQTATKRDDDYASTFANAMSMISMIGNNIDDVTAFGIIKPFLGDFQTMRGLSLALNNNPNVNVTLSALRAFEGMTAQLDVIARNYGDVFNTRASDSPMSFALATKMLFGDIDNLEMLESKLNTFIEADGGIENTFDTYHTSLFGLVKPVSDLVTKPEDDSTEGSEADEAKPETTPKADDNAPDTQPKVPNATESRSFREAIANNYGGNG